MKTKKIKLLLLVAFSVCAAFFGVQSQKNRLKDFNSNIHPIWYIAVGITIAFTLVIAIMLIVENILAN